VNKQGQKAGNTGCNCVTVTSVIIETVVWDVLLLDDVIDVCRDFVKIGRREEEDGRLEEKV
jgi:hypothetical protein